MRGLAGSRDTRHCREYVNGKAVSACPDHRSDKLTCMWLLAELQKIALDTLAFVLERIEAESAHVCSDQRVKIESVREWLRVKRECK